ncbi:FixH family protein [Endozoicomonas arenosclerae]|uniref:FixH family protein n=1 Tax=Endozoicomonas arenosclerae TaxID=1633495 RepID=UPI0007840C52|nr:FixH family protein [Endozoicomonas arenosclerae]
MSLVKNEPITRWYQEPWVWAILGVLAVTFVWGSYRIYYAFQIQDSVVVDDYYKTGKMINEDLTRDNNARDLGIRANLMIDDLTGEVRVNINGNLSEWPEQLKLSLLSPVFADRDKVVTMNRSWSGDESRQIYVGQVDAAVEGKTYVQLETIDEHIPEVGYETGWRLNQPLVLTPGETSQLLPRGSSAP